jgi:hypothetical protein
MKTFGYLLHLLSLLWLAAVGLHAFAHLFPAAHHLPPFLHWFRRLPLPNDPMGWRAGWPVLVGACGMFAGFMLVARVRLIERLKKENSEA